MFTQGIAQARWDEFLPWLRSGDGQLVAASLRDAVPYRGAPYQAPCFILVGNESRGLPDDYEVACDLRVTMPMKGRADSLNAAVAGAVLAYEVLAALDHTLKITDGVNRFRVIKLRPGTPEPPDLRAAAAGAAAGEPDSDDE